MSAPAQKPPGAPSPTGLKAVFAAFTSWRTGSVALLSIASGMPLGLVWVAMPDWMRSEGIDIRVVGLLSLAQAPWSFKVLWSPLLDRFAPPFLGRRRGWIVLCQGALLVLTFGLAAVAAGPMSPWLLGALALAMAIAAASQDIAYDAYAVEVLRPEEQGAAAGARTGLYRAGMYMAGGVSIWAAGFMGWPVVLGGLALAYLPMIGLTVASPEPERSHPAPRSLRAAVWEPFLGFLSRDRALQILAFVFFYKLADSLALSLLRPFLVDMGYSEFDRGVATSAFALFATIAGAFMGGVLSTAVGLGHCLWAFGLLQIFSNIGYVAVAQAGVNPPLMYAAVSFDNFTSGMGSAAFSVLLLRLTQKRFSATQFALFSSLVGLPRIVSGPISGFLVDGVGWEAFFWLTLVAGVPGMALLGRFVPAGTREPVLVPRPPRVMAPLGSGGLMARGLAGGGVGLLLGVLSTALLAALKRMRSEPASGFDLVSAVQRTIAPMDMAGWLTLGGIAIFAAVVGLMTAAVAMARRGGAPPAEDDQTSSSA